MDNLVKKYKYILILIVSFLKRFYLCNDFNFLFNFVVDIWFMIDFLGKCLMYLSFFRIVIFI